MIFSRTFRVRAALIGVAILLTFPVLVLFAVRREGSTSRVLTYRVDDGQRTIVCLGDSLTAGNGAPYDQSYPAWLQAQLDRSRLQFRVVNAGVSGNRVSDGLQRLQSDVLHYHPVLVIVELGSNDPGNTPASVWKAQLSELVARLRAHKIRVIVAGLDEPGMASIYREVADRFRVPLIWFMAEVMSTQHVWKDAHHPNGYGYRLVMKALWPTVEQMIRT